MINLKITNIDLIVYDFDGVMTNNIVFINQEGIEMVQVNRADRLGILEINKLGISQMIISTEKTLWYQTEHKNLIFYVCRVS